MRVKTLFTFRSKKPSDKMAAAATSIPDPQTAWVRSIMSETKIQALVTRGLLRPKEEVEWRAAAGEQFPSEDVKEQVVFRSFERGFNLPVGDFFRGLILLPIGASTPCSQLHYRSVDVH
jgi:hypothetical protein